MKKLMVCIMATSMSLTFIPSQSRAASEPLPVTMSPVANAESAAAAAMIARLEEIKAMDKSELSASEKKDLRKEVKTIKSDLKRGGGGVYLSVGAIIIIILLLILLI